MIFRLGEVVKPLEREIPIGPMELELGFHFAAKMEPCLLALSVTPLKGAHRVEGVFDYEALVPCSRCLKDVSIAGRMDFRQEFRPAPKTKKKGGEEVEVKPGEENLIFYEDDTVSAEDLVRQQLYLDLPEKPLCSESCKGLCPGCGADRNETSCGCLPEGPED